VDRADLEVILEAATHAPSAENRQPWAFLVVADPAARRAIDELTADRWAAGGRAHARARLSPAMFASVDEFLGGGYGGAPLLVVVTGDARVLPERAVLAASVYPAIQSLLLAAAALGYGAALTTLATRPPEDLAGVVGLPDEVLPFAVVPLGRPAVPLGRGRRRPVRDVAFLDRYGVSLPSEDAPRAR
jgi:nitroreductase